MVVYEKSGRDLHHIKEIKSAHVYQSIPYDIKKSSMVVFLNELIFQSVREIEKNESMFGFVFHSLLYLDAMKEHYQNFHLWFMLRFTHYLGFETTMNYAPGQEYFDLQEGKFTSLILPEELCIRQPLSQIFIQLRENEDFGSSLIISRAERRQLLYKLQQFYQFHLPGFDDLKSLPVMIEVLE
jgi:DNA repair protein RecO (recombination protein O)